MLSGSQEQLARASSLKRHVVLSQAEEQVPPAGCRMPIAIPPCCQPCTVRTASKAALSSGQAGSFTVTVQVYRLTTEVPQIWNATQPVPVHHQRVKHVVEHSGGRICASDLAQVQGGQRDTLKAAQRRRQGREAPTRAYNRLSPKVQCCPDAWRPHS